MSISSVSKLPISTQSALLAGWQAGQSLEELLQLAGPSISRSALHRFLRRTKKSERLKTAESKLAAIKQILKDP